MERGDQTKAERRQAKAGGQTKAERKQAEAGDQTKAERKQARAERKRGARPGVAAVPDVRGEEATPLDRIEWRLARIEEAVATQSKRSEKLLRRVEAMLQDATQSGAGPDSVGDWADSGGD